MTRSVVFAVPGDIATATGGYGYDRRMMAELAARGWRVAHLPLPGGFPFPSPDERAETEGVLDGLAEGVLVVVDGLAFGALAEAAARHRGRLRLVALVHHPLALETGLAPEAAEGLRRSEIEALAMADAVIATSGFTARQLVEAFGVDAVQVAPPGTDPGPPALGRGRPPLLVSVGALVPRKGHDVLIAALARVADLAWRCRIVGDAERDPATAAALAVQAEAAGLGARVIFAGQVADVRQELAGADLFVLASRHEGYGMAFAEALSQGLPVVGCATGAAPDLIPPEAGVLVPCDDPEALAQALRGLIADPKRRSSMAAGARAAGAALPTWAESAAALERALLAAAA